MMPVLRASLLVVTLAACRTELPSGGPGAGPDGGTEVFWNGPAPLLTRDARATKVVLDDENVYWLVTGTGGPRSILKRAKSGGPVVTLVTEPTDVRDFTVQGGHVYWTAFGDPLAQDGRVMRVPAAGGDSSVLASNQIAPNWLATDGDRVFWLALAPIGGPFGQVELRGLKLGATAVEVLDSGNTNYDDLALDDQFVYLSTGDGSPGIKRVPKVGGAMTAVVNGRVSRPIAIDSGYLYFNEYDKGLSQLSVAGGASRIVRGDAGGLPNIAVVGGNIYALGSDDFAIVQVSIDTGAATTVDTNLEPNQINHDTTWGIAADREYVYWTRTNYNASELVRAPVPAAH